jgi:RNA-binding protein YhbY
MSEENIKSGSERRLLKSSAKVREVDVKIGKKGLTQNVILEIQLVLKRDKMVKVSFRDEREKRVKLVEGIQEKIESTLVEFVGKTATFAL